ncbi:MAG: ATP-dependent sacrificial sulfur transferase LarE [Acidimicrobiia bacterium]
MIDRLADLDRVVVGFSGGVDSALLADLAFQALGDEALIVTAVSPALSDEALVTARKTAADRGWMHQEIHTFEMNRPEYVRNSPDRCFHCRSELFERLEILRAETGVSAIAVGTILDDFGDHRPGIQAAKEKGVITPLADVGFNKIMVREVARERGLDVADRPSDACLASRIPYGVPVTIKTLDMIEAAEDVIRQFGFATFRVRHHGKCARIEVSVDELPRLLELRSDVSQAIKAVGYSWVSLDLDGFRSGSANEALPGES